MIWCPICGESQSFINADDTTSWRHKHDQKNHPEYWEAQTGKKLGEEK